jgi:hypothetical protein
MGSGAKGIAAPLVSGLGGLWRRRAHRASIREERRSRLINADGDGLVPPRRWRKILSQAQRELLLVRTALPLEF